MIKVDRTRVPVPAVFHSSEMQAELARLNDFFQPTTKSKAQAESKAQTNYSFKQALLQEAKDALVELFHSKCAFCERRLKPGELKAEQFRPKLNAVNLDGKTDKDYYWWLAYEWQNLYPFCGSCISAKGARFPINGRRATVGAKGQALAPERPLLLDPCVDEPDKHLVFDESGKVLGLTPRGEITVEILALNRTELVSQRKSLGEGLRKSFTRIARYKDRQRLDNLITEELEAGLPFEGMRRQLLRRWLKNAKLDASHPLVQPESAASKRGAIGPRQDVPTTGANISQAKVQELAQASLAHDAEKEKHSVEKGSQQLYFSSARQRIERIEIRNFKAIERLELKFPEPRDENEAWLALLGENGTGKSSILQALALTLMGQQHCDSLGLDARRFVRRKARSDRGEVKVWLTGLPNPIVLSFNRNARRFRVEPPEPKVLLLGYGSTRLLPHYTREAESAEKYIRIRNLFVPTAPLNNAEKWLGSARQLKPRRFNDVVRALKDLLMVEDYAKFRRQRGKIEVVLKDGAVSLRDLSDGFQSVVALSTDIMISLFERWEDMQIAEGIVLIDELEVHLHPSWKIELVQRLRRCFPKVTFVATTHDPLCLKGLQEGEIVVLRRDEETRKVFATTDLPSVEEMRADQILTSPYFDLRSTRGTVPKAQRRYEDLMAKSKLTEAEQQELAQLRSELRQSLRMAESQTEQEAEQTFRRLIENELPASPRPKASKQISQPDPLLEAKIKKQLARLFKDV